MDICTQYNGFGEVFGAFHPVSIQCDLCNGKGKLSSKKKLWVLQGRRLKEERLATGLTLRKTALKYGIDVSNLSKMERGVIKPKNIFLKEQK